MDIPLSNPHGQFPGGGGIVNLWQLLRAKQGTESVLVTELGETITPSGVYLQNSFECID